jgi:ketosteroid isomerase-like protein
MLNDQLQHGVLTPAAKEHATSRNRFRRLPIALLLCLIPACAAAAAAHTSVDLGDNHASDEALLRALDEQWSATAAKNDIDGTVAFYAENAVLLPPNAPIATDARAIRTSWAGLLSPNTTLSWKVSGAEVASSGELGYVYGTYAMTIADPQDGAPAHDIGKFVEIWKKQLNGQWKCIVDTYNSDLPAITPVASGEAKD